jgi:UDP-glucose 4-epimerase
MNKIILLGGSGFIGKSLLPKLHNEKFHVKVMIHKDDPKIKEKKFKGNILSKGILDSEISDSDIIVNLIGQSDTNITNFIDLNVIGGLNLLNSCMKKKSIRILLVSSINVYGDNANNPSKEIDPLKPQSTYGIIKLMTEKIYEYYSKMYGLNITILRLSHLYGPHKKSGIVSTLIKSIKDGSKVTLHNSGKQFRDFLYVEDATDGIIQAIRTNQDGFNIFNISSGERHMIKDLVKIIEKSSHKKLRVMLSPEIPDEKCIWADNSKATKIIKFSPKISISEGLKFTIKSFKEEIR